MTPTDPLETDFQRLLQQAPFDDAPADEHRLALKQRVLDQFAPLPSPEPSPTGWQAAYQKGLRIMQRPAFRLLVAGLCLAIGTFWLFVPGGQTPAQAFNRFAAAIVATKTARFQMEVQIEGQPQQTFQAWYQAPGKFRQELGLMVNIADFEAGKIVSIIPAEKRVILMTIKGEGKKPPVSSNYFDRLRELLAKREQTAGAQYESLGEKQIDGKTAVGFRFDSPAATITLWGDPVTGQPLLIENLWSGVPRTEVKMTKFEVGGTLAESLFDLTPPEGYKVQALEMDASDPTEADLVKSLTTCAELSGGPFPDSLDSTGLMQFMSKSILAKAKGPNSFSDDEFQALMKQSIAIGRGFQFILQLPESAEAHYAGQGAKKDDKQRPIVWYKSTDKKGYRVVYADLTVKDAEAAPQVEGAKRIVKASQSTGKPAEKK
jgi:outer membrane lipoprotein-sorting protein